MQIFRTAPSLQQYLNLKRSEGKSIGFVATMGALHQGHLSLVHHASHENDLVVLSIFVNPTQFNNPDDLERYPRTLDEDVALLKTTSCEVVFYPEVQEMYPSEVKSDPIDLHGLDLRMEGTHRPGHFDGVATIVSRFFEIIEPTRAYFGEKDYQQLQVIRHVTKAKGLATIVVPHIIERNDQGLALSSRNSLLSDGDRHEALLIFQNLNWAKEQVKFLEPEELEQAIKNRFIDGPLQLEYVEVVNEENLLKIKNWNEAQHARIFIAAFISNVRLIDNLSLF